MILDAILHGIAVIFWYLNALLCELLDLIYQLFGVLVGTETVTVFRGETSSQNYLINVFFSNSTINKIYWAMALIGIALCGGFIVWAVIKKTFDVNDKMKSSYGTILTGAGKSVLIMLLMGLIVSTTINLTNVLMNSITDAFDYGDTLDQAYAVDFGDDDYATMYRIYNTIGNYSLNPNRDSRYNINSCFNDIRMDLQQLDKEQLLDIDYTKKKITGRGMGDDGQMHDRIATIDVGNSWQSVLVKIANSHSLEYDCVLNEYYPAVQSAILDCMDIMNKDSSFKPLPDRHIEATNAVDSSKITPGRIVMLTASMGASWDETHQSSELLGLVGGTDGTGIEEGAGLTDHIRLPYYVGDKDVYDLDEVEQSFSVDFGDWNHVVGILAAYFLIKEFAAALLNAVARIFNMLMLYLIAPLTLASYPLDEGGKFKQWTTSFIVQALGIFGTVISIRLLMLFIPIIMSGDVVLFGNPYANLVGKVVVMLGAGLTCSKASSIITGILADNAGLASLQAGDIGNHARSAVSAGKNLAVGVTKGATNVAATVTGAKAVGNAVGGAINSGINKFSKGGGLPGMLFAGGAAAAGGIKSKFGGGGSSGGGGGAGASTGGKSDEKLDDKNLNSNNVGGGGNAGKANDPNGAHDRLVGDKKEPPV